MGCVPKERILIQPIGEGHQCFLLLPVLAKERAQDTCPARILTDELLQAVDLGVEAGMMCCGFVQCLDHVPVRILGEFGGPEAEFTRDRIKRLPCDLPVVVLDQIQIGWRNAHGLGQGGLDRPLDFRCARMRAPINETGISKLPKTPMAYVGL